MKFSGDIRMLQSFGEIEEPFEAEQVGSSAMAYKRNPMRSERIASLARFVNSLESNANQTHAVQYFERTLDDSANRRLVIPEMFLATDAILLLMANVASGLEVRPRRSFARRVARELPFMATEELIVRAVRAGGDRQVAHELIRQHSLAASKAIHDGAEANDLLDRLSGDKTLGLNRQDIERRHRSDCVHRSGVRNRWKNSSRRCWRFCWLNPKRPCRLSRISASDAGGGNGAAATPPSSRQGARCV